MISVVILTQNEEKNIVDCIESLKWCDEILVIDDNSSDRTLEVAQKAGARVYSHALNNDFSRQRNFGLEKARGDWILFVDADERVQGKLKTEIQSKVKQNSVNGYLMKRIDFIWGRFLQYGEVGNIYLLRLAQKGTGKWKGRVHEAWDINGKIEKMENPLHHYPLENIADFLGKINFYTTLRAQELYEKNVKSGFFSILFYMKAKLILNYFIKRGFLDGNAGLVHALCMSFHSFLVRSKLWVLWNKK